MGIFQYTLFSYALTAGISYLVIGIIVIVNKIVSGSEKKGTDSKEEGNA
ncbi:MAG: hypothetical protein ACRC3H_04675 [Lachnospiraceae bacterium]